MKFCQAFHIGPLTFGDSRMKKLVGVAIVVSFLGFVSFVPKTATGSAEKIEQSSFTIDNATTESIGYVRLISGSDTTSLVVSGAGQYSVNVPAQVTAVIVNGQQIALPGPASVELPDQSFVTIQSEGTNAIEITSGKIIN
jgi:hypothetical protein